MAMFATIERNRKRARDRPVHDMKSCVSTSEVTHACKATGNHDRGFLSPQNLLRKTKLK